MSLALAALISRTEAALAKEADPTKKVVLSSRLEAYKKTKQTLEKHESEEGGDEDEEEEEEKGNDTDRSEDADDGDGDDDGDEDEDKKKDDDEEDDEEEKSSKKAGLSIVDQRAALAAYRSACEATGKVGMAAVGALSALVSEAKALPALRQRVAKIEARDTRSKLESLIAAARSERRITPAEAKSLAGKKLDFVRAYLDMRPTSAVAALGEEFVPRDGTDGRGAGTAALTVDQAKIRAAMTQGMSPEQLRSYDEAVGRQMQTLAGNLPSH